MNQRTDTTPQSKQRSRPVPWCAAVLILIGSTTVRADDAAADLAAGIDAFNRGDVVTAIGHLRSSADAGEAQAQVRLAYLLDQAEEDAEAVRYYRLAAEQNDASGQLGLAGMYAKGEGIPADNEEAVRWFRAAADNGDTKAMMVLSYAYEEGGLGLAADLAEATRWTTMAASLGDDAAATRLEKLSQPASVNSGARP